jgi:hypothetical protein
VVVADIDNGNYESPYLEAEWSYLKKGALIYSEQGGIFHYDEDHIRDITFVSRASP